MIPENDQNVSGHKSEMFVFRESRKFCIAVNKRLFLKPYSCIKWANKGKDDISSKNRVSWELYSCKIPTGTTLWEHC